MLPNAVHLGMSYNNIYHKYMGNPLNQQALRANISGFEHCNPLICQVLMQHLDGLEEVQQSHEFEMANLLAEP